MNPKLIQAVRERIAAGTSKEDIVREVQAAGYSAAESEEAYSKAAEGRSESTRATQGQAEQSTPTTEARRPPEPPPSTPPAGVALPSVWSLLLGGLRFVFVRTDIALLTIAFAALVIFSNRVLAYHISYIHLDLIVPTIALAGVCWVLLFTIHTFAMMYVAVQTSHVSYWSGVQFSCRHILSLVWINILFSLLVFGATMLLIIPGIIVFVYAVFSYYAFIRTNTRGLSAFLLSRQLVRHHWWPVALRVVGGGLLVGIVFVGVVMGLVLVAGLLVTQNSTFIYIWNNILIPTTIAAIALAMMTVFLRMLALLYQSLEVKMTEATAAVANVSRAPYALLAVFGLLMMFVAPIVISTTIGSLESAQSDVTEALHAQQTAGFASQAEIYRSENGTYEGVCDIASSYIEAPFTCADSSTAYALETEISAGAQYFCISSDVSFVRSSAPARVGAACVE